MKDENDIIQVTEQLYKEINPDSKSDVPSHAYEIVERWKEQWIKSNSQLSLYKWIKENKNNKT